MQVTNPDLLNQRQVIPLWMIAAIGKSNIVELLLNTKKVDINSDDEKG
jgi:hypothetical protein